MNSHTTPNPELPASYSLAPRHTIPFPTRRLLFSRSTLVLFHFSYRPSVAGRRSLVVPYCPCLSSTSTAANPYSSPVRLPASAKNSPGSLRNSARASPSPPGEENCSTASPSASPRAAKPRLWSSKPMSPATAILSAPSPKLSPFTAASTSLSPTLASASSVPSVNFLSTTTGVSSKPMSSVSSAPSTLHCPRSRNPGVISPSWVVFPVGPLLLALRPTL